MDRRNLLKMGSLAALSHLVRPLPLFAQQPKADFELRIAPVQVEAVLLYEDRGFWHHPGIDPLALARGAWAFVRTYVLRRGFLDGRAGFMIAVFNAETVYYRFLKLGHEPAR